MNIVTSHATTGGFNADQISVILLVAGVGRRLGAAVAAPKVLLEFGGQTLLERHLRGLIAQGIKDIVLTVGFESDQIRQELARLGLDRQIGLIENPDFRAGSLVSLWVQAQRLRAGRTVLLMDGDVLYDPAMIGRLLRGEGENILLLDRTIEPGDEPVKICLRGGQIVDLRKIPANPHDWYGESVGFFRFSPDMAGELAERCDWYVSQGLTSVEYEEAIRDLILKAPARFAAAEVSDIPWTEIDFAEDVSRARDVILPRLTARS